MRGMPRPVQDQAADTCRLSTETLAKCFMWYVIGTCLTVQWVSLY